MRLDPLKVLAVSGSRADWGYLSVPLRMLREDPAFRLMLTVTGQHLDRSSGNTIEAIEAEGFVVDATVDMELGSDTARDVTRSMGLGLARSGDVIAALRPDLMFVLGDRYEILA